MHIELEDNRKHIALYFGVFEDERVGLWTFSVQCLKALLEYESEQSQRYCFWVFVDCPTAGLSTLKALSDDFPASVRIIQLGFSGLPRKLRMLLELLRSFRGFDLVHATANFCPVLLRPPLILHLHDLFQAAKPVSPDKRESHGLRSCFYRWLFGALFRRAYCVITDLHSTEKEIRTLTADKTKIYTISPPLILNDEFKVQREIRDEVALFCSADRRKWLVEFLESITPSTLAGVKLVLFSSAMDIAEQVIEVLQRKEFSYELVLAADRSLLMSRLSHCRALAFPSIAEGFGYPVYEALALGVTVLCRHHVAEPLMGTDASLLMHTVADDFEESFNEVMQSLLSARPSYEQRMSAAKTVRSLLTPENFASAVFALYQQALEKN